LHWSADLGASWSQGTAEPTTDGSLTLSHNSGELSTEAPVWELDSSDKMVFAGAAAGVYYSENRGRTWTRSQKGLPAESPGVSFLIKPAFVLVGIVIRKDQAKLEVENNTVQPVQSKTK
jgi:hypothetical protein